MPERLSVERVEMLVGMVKCLSDEWSSVPPRLGGDREMLHLRLRRDAVSVLPSLLAEVIERRAAEKEQCSKSAEAVRILEEACRIDDPETAHEIADSTLCEFLDHIDYPAVAAAFQKVEKWYS